MTGDRVRPRTEIAKGQYWAPAHRPNFRPVIVQPFDLIAFDRQIWVSNRFLPDKIPSNKKQKGKKVKKSNGAKHLPWMAEATNLEAPPPGAAITAGRRVSPPSPFGFLADSTHARTCTRGCISGGDGRSSGDDGHRPQQSPSSSASRAVPHPHFAGRNKKSHRL